MTRPMAAVRSVLVLVGLCAATMAHAESEPFADAVDVPGPNAVDRSPNAHFGRMGGIQRLTADDIPTIVVPITAAAREQLRHSRDDNGHSQLIGVGLAVDEAVDFGAVDPAVSGDPALRVGPGIGRFDVDRGSAIWATRVVVPGAGSLALVIDGLDLPPGLALFVYTPDGDIDGPYAGHGPHGDGFQWSREMRGEELLVELRSTTSITLSTLRRARFTLSKVAWLGGDESLPASGCPDNVPCVNSAECYASSSVPPMDWLRRAVALVYYTKDGGASFYGCSGALITDRSDSGIPYFITAAHCFSSQQTASTARFYWDYRKTGCNGTCRHRSEFQNQQGSTLLYTSEQQDVTFLRLSSQPPGARTYLGWSAANIAPGTTLHRVAHPYYQPQSYSAHQVLSASQSTSCNRLPRPDFIYSRTVVGGTEGGSSGGVAVTAEGRIVGQLYGDCGSNLSNECDHANNNTVDGAFARYFSSISRWLDPPTTTPPTPTPMPTPTPGDDHGNSPSTATLIPPNSTTAGVIERPGDHDVFRIVLPTAGRLTAYTTGSTDTYGSLLDDSGAVLESNDDHTERNFRLERDVAAGSYFVQVRHYLTSSGTGAYVLRVEFAPVTAQSGALQVIIEPAAAQSAGARWRRNGTTTWRTSGSTETGILVGSHAVEFQTISGWSTPSNAIVTVTANQTTTITRSYGSISGPRLVIAATTGTSNPVITASLDNPSGIPIAGMQLDLIPMGISIHATSMGRPDCSVNPAINKGSTSYAFFPSGCSSSGSPNGCVGIRALVMSLSNVDPIPHGAELFQCRATAERSQYTVNCDNAGASSPDGEPIGVNCTPFSGNGGMGPDRNGDGMVDDFELLDYIDLWIRGDVDDFALLDAIDSWARR